MGPRPVWTGGKSPPYRDSILDRPARSQTLYRLRYRAKNTLFVFNVNVTQWAESEWNYVSCLIVVWLNNCLSCLVLPCQVIYTVFGLLKLRIVFFTEVYRRLEGCV